MTRRLLLGLLVALCVLPAAGCGGGGSSTGAGAADVVPQGVPVYVSISTDVDGDQITQARELLSRFPGSSGLLRMLEAELESDGDLDFEQDIRPALGPTLDIALLEVHAPGSGQEPPVVALLQPDDPARFDALLAESPEDQRPVTVEVAGWTAVADSQAVLDQFQAARDTASLADSEAFEQAMDGIDEDALARAYVDIPALVGAASAATTDPLQGQLGELVQLAPLGAAVIAEENGFRLEATTTTEQESSSFEPELPSSLPAGALVYAGFGDVATSVREALNKAGEQNPQLDQQLAQLELALGVSLDEDILPLLQQETAIAVYPGAEGSKLPAFVVAMRVEDTDAALQTIDRIFARAGEFGAGVPEPRPSEVGGIPVREISLPDGTTIVYGGADRKLFATSEPELVAGLAGDGPKLADDEAFTRAQEIADVPGEVGSLLFVDLNTGADYALDLAEQSGSPAPGPVRDNVEPLHSLFLYGTQDGDRVRASGFLALDE